MEFRAALFRNIRKRKDSQPDYTGTGNVVVDNKGNRSEDIEVSVRGWAHKSKNGNQYLSLIIKCEDVDVIITKKDPEMPNPIQSPRQEGPPEKDPFKKNDDDLPF